MANSCKALEQSMPENLTIDDAILISRWKSLRWGR